MSGTRLRSLGRRVALLLVAAPLALRAQQGAETRVNVTGVVINEANGTPVPGVAIAVKGSAGSAMSGDDGHFNIIVGSLLDTLVARRIGFAQATVPLGGRNAVEIRLHATAVALSEVVTVGYGTQKRSDITGSVGSLSAEKIQEKPNTNVTQALEGQLAGVNVTTVGAGAESQMSIRIRGRASITASASPLVIVDGLPYEGALSEIDPNDIASLEVLKDASSTAIYGSRAANGVLLVTTRRGKAGGPPRITYSSYAGTQHIANLPRPMSGPEFAQFKCDRLSGGTNCSSVLTATEQANVDAGTYTDWLGLATRTGDQMQHNLSVSGSQGGASYYVGGSYLDVNGVARNDNFKRYLLRGNLDIKLRDWLTLGTSTNGVYSDRSGIADDFSAAYFMNPLTNAFDTNGNLTLYPWPEDVFWGNPLANSLVIDDNTTKRIFSSNYALVTIPWVTGLTYRLNVGGDVARNEVGNFWGRNTQTGFENGGQALTSTSARTNWTAENIVRYSRTFGPHTVDFTGLYSFEGQNYTVSSLRTEGLPNDVLGYHQPGTALFYFPDESVTERTLRSKMGRLNYNFADRYLATLTERIDCASVFPPGNKCASFPAVALGWNISNEAFYPFKQWVNLLKLRTSYGSNGNQGIAPYSTLPQMDAYPYVDNGATAPGYRPVSLGRANVRWETTNALDAGLDFSIRNDRVRGTVDVYSRWTRDLLLNQIIPLQYGVTHIVNNIGRTKNTGAELELSSLNATVAGVEWRSDFNISYNRNRIVSLLSNGNDVANQWFIGMPIDVNYGYKFDGIFQDSAQIANSAQPRSKPGDVRILDVNRDGTIDVEDRTFIGSTEPKYIAGLTNSLTWKGVQLSAQLQSVQGITRSNELMGSNLVQAGVRRNTIPHEYWTPENHTNSYPANNETSNPLSVAFYEDASFIRLRDLTLAWNVPDGYTSRIGADRLRVYLTGRNLWTRTGWHGLDPELDAQRSIPLEKTYVGGLSVTF